MARRGASLNYVSAKSVRRQPQFSAIDKSSSLFVTGISCLFVLLIAGSVFYVGVHSKAANFGYKINDEIQRKERLIEENKRLELEIARLKSPLRIEVEAKDRLGMVLAKSNQVVFLSKLDNPRTLESFAANVSSKKPSETIAPPSVPASPAHEKPKQTAVAVPKISGKKVAEASRTNQGSRKTTDQGSKKTTNKENSQVLLAKIVSAEVKRPAEVQPKQAPAKTKQRVPAAMLDPFP